MIIPARKEHKEQIIELWNEAFGDKKEDVLKYLDYLFQYFFVYVEDEKVLSMAALLPIFLESKKGRYVYAVATKKEAQGMGLSTKVLEHLKAFIKENNEEFLVLVPAKKSLFDFYEKRGFTLAEGKIKREAYLPEKSFGKVCAVSASEYETARNSLGKRVFRWQSDALEFARAMYDGAFVKTEIGTKNAYAFCFMDGKKLIVKELILSDLDKESALGNLAEFFGAESVECSEITGIGSGFSMVYPDEFKDVYFNIALD